MARKAKDRARGGASEAPDGGSAALPAAAPPAAADAPKARKGGLGAVIMLTILSLIVGGAGGLYLAAAVEEVVSERAEETADQPTRELRYSGETRLFRLEPIVANLGAPQDVWVRLQTAIVFQNGALANPEATAAEIGQDILTYLRTVTLGELEGPSALAFLREDLGDRARIRTEGRVDEIVVESMVVQ